MAWSGVLDRRKQSNKWNNEFLMLVVGFVLPSALGLGTCHRVASFVVCRFWTGVWWLMLCCWWQRRNQSLASHIKRNCESKRAPKVMNRLGLRAGRIQPGRDQIWNLFQTNTPAHDTLVYFQENPNYGTRYEYVRMVGTPGAQVSYTMPLVFSFGVRDDYYVAISSTRLMSASKRNLSIHRFRSACKYLLLTSNL